MTFTTRRRILSASGSALVLGLAGCAGQSDDETGGAQSPAPTRGSTPQSTPEPTSTERQIDPVTLAIGETYDGEVTEDTPVDPTYTNHAVPIDFEVSDPVYIGIIMESPDFDSWFSWTAPDGSHKTQAYGGDTPAYAEKWANQSGTHRIWAGSYPNDFGSFTLTLEETDTPTPYF